MEGEGTDMEGEGEGGNEEGVVGKEGGVVGKEDGNVPEDLQVGILGWSHAVCSWCWCNLDFKRSPCISS